MIMMKYPLKYIPCLLVITLLFSCTSAKKTAAAMEEQQTLPELPLSELDIPVRLAAAPIMAKAEHLVPAEFTSNAWPQFMQPSCDFRYKYRFVRTALQISCNNNLFNIRFGGNYQVSGTGNAMDIGKLWIFAATSSKSKHGSQYQPAVSPELCDSFNHIHQSDSTS
jgi:hypothetical protein